jgi:glyoxylase-like metal-dependent hydrolase (beta-lactamase superfamily II)
VDAGIHPDFCVKVSGNFGRLLGKMIKIKTGQGRDVLSQIKQIGLEAANIKAIIMSHLHPDHSSGLPLFQGNPHCTVYADEREYKKAESPGGIFQGYLKAHYKGLVIQPFTCFTGIEPFDQVSDFFGDESVFIIRTPGHTAGHISVLLNMQGGPVLLTVDAAHRQENLTGQIPTVGDYRQSLASLQKLQAFTSAHPATRVIYAHDPDQINGLKLFPEYYE